MRECKLTQTSKKAKCRPSVKPKKEKSREKMNKLEGVRSVKAQKFILFKNNLYSATDGPKN